MTKIRVLHSSTNNPWFNLAIEDWIFRHLDHSTHILYLWQNDPTVVIGQHQNPWAECRLDKMEADNIYLARRQSGGGAVFHDLGNTNFTFLSSKANYQQTDNFDIIIKALKTFAISAELSGRNDLTVGDKKISGSAFKHTSKLSFHHGTLLVNADLTQLANYLNPHPLKLEAKGIKSVRSRVANLCEFNAEINHKTICEAITDAFCAHYETRVEPELLDIEVLKEIDVLDTYYQKMSDSDWRFGKTPEFDHKLETRFTWGIVDINLKVKQGVIDECVVFSDALDVDFIDVLRNLLLNNHYSITAISEKMSALAMIQPQFKGYLTDIEQWFRSQAFFIRDE
ncbi:lipoate--protein ligase [Psychromonas sp. RZ22]|uniref:lipoate--protein ligase n=1 Tax=Psychromonas algarum TaxID=2555643 RepID=UPI00106851A6|nr:lipoate--protein ligase [Psychromonas sp. RZ22]TEW56053.1 lipoate--protein ligase [Psychromonas sp. RZ22]